MVEIDKRLSPEEKEKVFYEFLVAEYLRHGSVDAVFKVHDYDIPISYPEYQRVLSRWGVVKAAGPNSKLSEVLEFLTRLAEQKVPLEMLYRSVPDGFKTSVSTMHRILRY